MEDDRGWIRTLMDEAENERMHLMTFIEVPADRLRALHVISAQWLFYMFFFGLYIVGRRPRTVSWAISRKKR